MAARRVWKALFVALVACSSKAATESTPTLPTPSETTTSAEAGSPDSGGGAHILEEETPDVACPAPFDAPGHGPAQGTNTDFLASGQKRSFELLLPPSTFSGPRPVLVAFHGTTENATKFMARAKLADFAARGFLVIAPNAVGNGSIWPVWDAMRAPGTESAPNADVALFDQLLKCTAAHHSIDKTRIFATGHSAGGIFTNRLLRTRSSVLAGGIVASGIFDLTGSGSPAALSPMTVIVTWGGDNDSYKGTTPNGVTVPAFSFVEQASLASIHYENQASVGEAYCRGANLGHAWLPINAWFADVMLARPKGSPKAMTLPTLSSGQAMCTPGAYTIPAVAPVTCAPTARNGCQEACQLFADCGVENRTVGVALSSTLSSMGFGPSTCSGCVSQCQSAATSAADASVLACFESRQATASCGPGIEGAFPLFEAVNACCKNRTDSSLCVQVCTSLMQNEAAAPFFSACANVAQ